MPKRLLLPLALAVLSVALLPPAAGAAVKLPKGVKTAKVTQFPVTVDAVGYLDYKWTFDTTKSCTPGYAKTIDESLTFELGRPQAAKVGIVNGRVVMYPVMAGEATVTTELSGWQTSNYCPPNTPAAEPPEPTCKKKLRSKLGVGIGPVKEERGVDDPTPLATPTQVMIFRTKATPQTPSCSDQRPKIETQGESTKGWHADPYAGILAPLGATDWQFHGLKVGETMRRTVTIGGGCGKASFGGAGASRVSSSIRSCVVKGKAVVIIKRTGAGFSTY